MMFADAPALEAAAAAAPATTPTVVVTTAAPTAETTAILTQAATQAAVQTNGFTSLWGMSINPSAIALMVIVAGLVFLIIQAQRSPEPFDLRDLVMKDRHLDPSRFCFMTSFAVSNWVIIDSQIKNRLDSTIFGLYIGSWVLALIVKETGIHIPGIGGKKPEGT